MLVPNFTMILNSMSTLFPSKLLSTSMLPANSERLYLPSLPIWRPFFVDGHTLPRQDSSLKLSAIICAKRDVYKRQQQDILIRSDAGNRGFQLMRYIRDSLLKVFLISLTNLSSFLHDFIKLPHSDLHSANQAVLFFLKFYILSSGNHTI